MSEPQAEKKEVVRASREFLMGRDTISPAIPFKRQIGNVLYEGEFRFRRPDWKTDMAIEVLKAEIASKWNDQLHINEAMPVSERGDLYAEAVASLQYVIAEKDGKLCAPDWWDLDLLQGTEGHHVIVGVYLAYMEWERPFFRPVEGPAKDGPPTSSP